MTGPVGDDALRACYRRAAVTVTPSLAEGFGLPVLESAACGTPALASATTALVEVAATALATFDPTDTEAMAGAIVDVLADDGRRGAILSAQRDLAARSTWDVVASRTADALDELGRSLPGAAWGPPSLRRRVALVGPLPPLGGGIGLYNRRVLEARAVRRGARRRHARWWPHRTCPTGSATSRPPPSGSTPGPPRTTPSSTPSAIPMDISPPSSWPCAIRDGCGSTRCGSRPSPSPPSPAPTTRTSPGNWRGWWRGPTRGGRPPVRPAGPGGPSSISSTPASGSSRLLTERCRGLLVNSEVARRLVRARPRPPGPPSPRPRPAPGLPAGVPRRAGPGVARRRRRR